MFQEQNVQWKLTAAGRMTYVMLKGQWNKTISFS